MKKIALWSGMIWIIIFAGIGVYGLRQRNSYYKDLAIYQELKAKGPRDLLRKPIEEFDKALFLEVVRRKYPVYRDWDDEELYRRLLAKYPVYKDQIDLISKLRPDYNDYYEIFIILLFIASCVMGFKYLVLASIIGFRKVVRKELIILWSVVIYTIAVISIGAVSAYKKYPMGEIFLFLLSGWLIAGATYLTYRIRKR